jgi:hypothetical protein
LIEIEKSCAMALAGSIWDAYLCPDCGCDQLKRYGSLNPQEIRDQVLSTYLERPSIRGPERTFGINCLTITSWIKKPKSRGYGLACVGARAKSWPMPWAGAAQTLTLGASFALYGETFYEALTRVFPCRGVIQRSCG